MSTEAADPGTARSGEVGTQTELPKVDTAIQAELSDLAPAAEAPTAAVAATSSRPATTASKRPATNTSRRPSTQSRSKPATAAAPQSSGGSPASRPTTQRMQLTAAQRSAPAPEPAGQPGILFVDNNRTWRQYQESSPQQRQQGGPECTPMVYSYNPDPRLRAWQSLEHARLHQMGLSSKLSRRYNVQRSRQFVPVGLHMRAQQQQQLRAAFLPPLAEEFNDSDRKKNDVAPFLTFQKPTCGYFFSRETENRKIKHGLAPADLPLWGADLSQ
ncbi:hypothetical protein BOX15_Mlig030980g3 [Macrostomum lignano]|nr:hypothetical protein BOX15_Mlig030980g1 [Macrostomum lignano]PAA80075.1 hypothetical protein BOX15_Mlig030980g3 [Macrostomum lignano]